MRGLTKTSEDIVEVMLLNGSLQLQQNLLRVRAKGLYKLLVLILGFDVVLSLSPVKSEHIRLV